MNLKQLEEGVLSNVKDTHLSSPPTTDQSLPRAGIAQRCRTTIMAHEVWGGGGGGGGGEGKLQELGLI